MTHKHLLVTAGVVVFSMTVMLSPVVAAELPTELRQMREVIARPMVVDAAHTGGDTTRRKKIESAIRDVGELQQDFARSSDDPGELTTRAKVLKREIGALKEQIETGNNPAVAGGGASATPAARSVSQSDEVQRLLEELAYREALIDRLVSQVETDRSHASGGTSELAASLLAISEHPTAAGGVAIFIFMLIWLFRGRIAELSGFGVKVSFHPDTESEADDDVKKV